MFAFCDHPCPDNACFFTWVKLVVDNWFQEERVVFSLPSVFFKDLHSKLKESTFEVLPDRKFKCQHPLKSLDPDLNSQKAIFKALFGENPRFD